jgi:hypothetical protein
MKHNQHRWALSDDPRSLFCPVSVEQFSQSDSTSVMAIIAARR